MCKSKYALHYGCVWEDADILCQALAPVALNRRLLSISSAGDNSLALLTLDPKEVVAVDLDDKQLAALDLRARAFEVLPYDQLLAFLGVSDCSDRLQIYRRLRSGVAEQHRAFWDHHPKAVQRGIIHAGRFERYMGIVRRLFSRRITGALAQLSLADTAAQRKQIYDSELNGFFWRSVTAIGFSPKTVSVFDSYRRYFNRATVSVIPQMRERLRRMLIATRWKENPYLTYFLTGNFSCEALPLYLRQESYFLIRSRIARLSLHKADVAEAASFGSFSGFNLSNVFQYQDPVALARTFNAVLTAADREARLVYWYNFTDDIKPTSGRIMPLPLAKYLQAQDKVGTYESFHVDEVSGDGKEPVRSVDPDGK